MSFMNRAAFSVVRTLIRAASALSPDFGARLAYPLFGRVGPRLPVSPLHTATHDAACRSTITANGRTMVAYEWGEGGPTVLLVHGWRGRASQFGDLVRELRNEKYRVIAFDAPANGESPGRRTTIIDYIAAIKVLDQQYGGFDAIVGHSLGALAVLVSASGGVRARKLVGVSGVSGISYLSSQFLRMAGLPPSIDAALRKRSIDKIFTGDPTAVDRYSAISNPAPLQTPLLLLHDETDRVVDIQESRRILAAHEPNARLVTTQRLGHNRILSSDVLLDEILDFLRPNRNAYGTRNDIRSSRPTLR